MFVPACKISCFPLTCVCNKDNPLSIFTPFIIALLPIIEPLAKILPVTSNFSVAAVDAPILNPLSLMLCKGISLILNSIAETPLKPVIPVFVLYANKLEASKVLFNRTAKVVGLTSSKPAIIFDTKVVLHLNLLKK